MVPDIAGLHYQKKQILNLKLQLGILGCATETEGEDLGLGPFFAIASPTFAWWSPPPKFPEVINDKGRAQLCESTAQANGTQVPLAGSQYVRSLCLTSVPLCKGTILAEL